MSTSGTPPPPKQPGATAAGGSSEAEELPPPPTLCGCLCACLMCLVITPCLVLCCCCAAGDHAVNRAQGKRWDAVQRRWVIDNLEDEAKALEQVPKDDDDILKKVEAEAEKEVEAEKTAASASTTTKTVKETKYYDVLGVSVDAEDSKIKKVNVVSLSLEDQVELFSFYPRYMHSITI